jgi:uncharacterized protein YbjT (DUF2867 family)
MSKILAVFGATDQQGGSVVEQVLNDTELSLEYKIRIITRNPDSTKATQLKVKVEVVRGDVNDARSLRAALTGVHTVFAMTTVAFDPDTLDEYSQAKQIADAAVETGVQYIIFSTLPSARDISGSKYTRIGNFDAKADAEKYIRGLPIKSAFISLGGFMENYVNVPFVRPQPAGDGTYVLINTNPPYVKMPLLNGSVDTGKFVGAILADPDKFLGKTICASQGLYSWEETAVLLSKSSGKTVVHKQVSEEDFAAMIPTPAYAGVLIDSFKYFEEYGYYRPGMEKSIKWAVSNARGRLTSFDEYLEKNPLQLE